MKIDGTRSNDRATELILAYYAAFNRGDWDAMLALLGERHRPRPQPGSARDRPRGLRVVPAAHGDAAIANSCTTSSSWCRPDGARAAAEYIVHGEYVASDAGLPPARGQKYVLPGGAFFEVRDGRIQRVSNYYNLEDWITQVGVIAHCG